VSEATALPKLDALTRGQRALATLSLVAASALLVWNVVEVSRHLHALSWWIPPALFAGIAAADFLSGLVHWAADTWGRDDTPIVGPRLLVPFRVHHVNPDDFVTRPFLDTNGDVALIAVPILAAARLIPFETAWGGPLAVSCLGFAGVGMLTNQIHQWAHLPSPPHLIRWLQRCRLILSPTAHERHHGRPYDASYCIATGWWNPPLDAIQFFRRLERVVTLLTGIVPRIDDARYVARLSDS
jgi:hypothetical protein